MTKPIIFKNVDHVLKELGFQIERTRIGFLDSETPRMLTLLQEAKATIIEQRIALKTEKKRIKALKRFNKTLEAKLEKETP